MNADEARRVLGFLQRHNLGTFALSRALLSFVIRRRVSADPPGLLPPAPECDVPLSVRDLLGCITPDIESMLSGLGDRNVVIGEGEEDVVRCFSTMLRKFKSSALIVGLTLLLSLSLLLLNPFVGELDESLA